MVGDQMAGHRAITQKWSAGASFETHPGGYTSYVADALTFYLGSRPRSVAIPHFLSLGEIGATIHHERNGKPNLCACPMPATSSALTP